MEIAHEKQFKNIDRRFEDINRRLDHLEKQVVDSQREIIRWVVGLFIGVALLIVALNSIFINIVISQ